MFSVECLFFFGLYFLLLVASAFWGYLYRWEKEKEKIKEFEDLEKDLMKEIGELRHFKHNFPDEWDKYKRIMKFKEERDD